MRTVNLAAAGLLALMLMAPASFASSKHGPLQLDAVRVQQAEIRAGAEAGKGRYKDMPAATRQALFAEQAKVLKLLEGKKVETELTENDKMQVFNALESIEAIVNQAEDERVVCKREKATGSNRLTSVCRTVAQMREDREAAAKMDRTAVCSEGTMCSGR